MTQHISILSVTNALLLTVPFDASLISQSYLMAQHTEGGEETGSK